MGGFERWNGHLETLVEQEVFGLTLQLAQDPSSLNLGTSVWDASIVLAKYLELVRSKRALGTCSCNRHVHTCQQLGVFVLCLSRRMHARATFRESR